MYAGLLASAADSLCVAEVKRKVGREQSGMGSDQRDLYGIFVILGHRTLELYAVDTEPLVDVEQAALCCVVKQRFQYEFRDSRALDLGSDFTP